MTAANAASALATRLSWVYTEAEDRSRLAKRGGGKEDTVPRDLLVGCRAVERLWRKTLLIGLFAIECCEVGEEMDSNY